MSIKFDNPKIQEFMQKKLGSPIDKVFHAIVPFHFGFDKNGAADVFLFKRPDNYISYVTGDLIGTKQKPSDCGNYELLSIMKDGQEWGAKLIRVLAYYTLDASINSGETMDIGNTGKNVGFEAIIFDKYAETVIDGNKIGIMLVIGITKKELDWKFKNSGMALIQKLKEAKVYPYTIPKRKSIL